MDLVLEALLLLLLAGWPALGVLLALMRGAPAEVLRAKLLKRPLLLVASPDGTARVVAARGLGPTALQDPRRRYAYFISEGAMREKRYVLEGAGVPVLVAWAPRAVALSPAEAARLDGGEVELRGVDVGEAARRAPGPALSASSVLAAIRYVEAAALAEARALPWKAILVIGVLVVLIAFAASLFR